MIKKTSLMLFSMAVWASAQQRVDELRTRQLWDDTLLEKRPSPAKTPATRKPQSRPLNGALVGVTVWRLRPSNPGDTREVRALIHEDGGEAEWTPERVSAGAPLAEGQKVRISTEIAQEGYLYVIDRDEYADGTKGDARLIFPTLRMRGGDNRVTPGMVVEVPAPEDKPPYFKVTRSRPDQINEELTFLISPKRLAELKIGWEPLKVDEDQLARWAKQWKAQSHKLEDAAQEGKVYTVAEKEAARGGKLLTRDDPLPQTMYYVDSKAGDVVMLEVPLRIAK